MLDFPLPAPPAGPAKAYPLLPPVNATVGVPCRVAAHRNTRNCPHQQGIMPTPDSPAAPQVFSRHI